LFNFWSAECPQAARVDKEITVNSRSWNDHVVFLTIASNKNESQEQINAAAFERSLQTVLIDDDQQAADLMLPRRPLISFRLMKMDCYDLKGALKMLSFASETRGIFI